MLTAEYAENTETYLKFWFGLFLLVPCVPR